MLHLCFTAYGHANVWKICVAGSGSSADVDAEDDPDDVVNNAEDVAANEHDDSANWSSHVTWGASDFGTISEGCKISVCHQLMHLFRNTKTNLSELSNQMIIKV